MPHKVRMSVVLGKALQVGLLCMWSCRSMCIAWELLDDVQVIVLIWLRKIGWVATL